MENHQRIPSFLFFKVRKKPSWNPLQKHGFPLQLKQEDHQKCPGCMKKSSNAAVTRSLPVFLSQPHGTLVPWNRQPLAQVFPPRLFVTLFSAVWTEGVCAPLLCPVVDDVSPFPHLVFVSLCNNEGQTCFLWRWWWTASRTGGDRPGHDVTTPALIRAGVDYPCKANKNP